MRVLKFGGKSLETKEKFSHVCEFIGEIYKKDKQIIVVVSAIGQTTDNLIALGKDFGNTIGSNRELALLLSTGETQSASLFAMRLISMDIPAKSFSGKDIDLLTFGDYTNSRVAYMSKQKLLDAINNDIVVVVAGFQGVNQAGEVTTLGRGGSDITATTIATIFDSEVEIYSDFDGVFAGDPRLNNYKKFDFISYDSMIKMAKAGAKVLDSRAIKIAKENKITIISKSSTEPLKNGTIVSNLEKDIISINRICDLCKITITFSNNENIDKILKNVFFILNNYKFYNFQIFDGYLEFFVEQNLSDIILQKISEKLNILQK